MVNQTNVIIYHQKSMEKTKFVFVAWTSAKQMLSLPLKGKYCRLELFVMTFKLEFTR